METYRTAADVFERVRARLAATTESERTVGRGAHDLPPNLVWLRVRQAVEENGPSGRAAAFTAAEQAMARVSLGTLGRARARDVGGVDPDLLAREDELTPLGPA